MKNCLRQKCGKEFEPTKPKQVYCSTKCRTYAYREKKVEPPPKKDEPKKTVKPDTPKKDAKEMPPGLDKGGMLRWLRENG